MTVKKSYWAPAALCAIALLAYANSFQAGFSLDSTGILLQDRIHAATAENLRLILDHTYWWPYGESGLYRPLTTLTYLFNYSILGDADQPLGYHIVNFLLHAGNVLLVYVLALRLFRTPLFHTPWKAFAAAAIWAVHPVLTESVTNIAGRADLLAAMAVLGGLWMYLQSAERPLWLGGVALAALAGVFCKENAVVLPAVLALWELCGQKRWRTLAMGCLAVTPALAAMFFARAAVLGNAPAAQIPFLDNPLAYAGFWSGKLAAVRLMAKYLALFIWPARLSWDYSYAQIPLSAGSLIAVAAVAALAALAWRFQRTVFFAIGFAFVTILPTSNIVLPIGSIFAERFLYLPAIGLAICLVEAADRLQNPRAAQAVLAIAGVAFAARTLTRNADWKNNLTISAAGVAISPDSYKTHQALAAALMDASSGNVDYAIAEAEKALAIVNWAPANRVNPDVFRQAAGYYRAKDDQLSAGQLDGQPDGPINHRVLTAESRAVVQRELDLLLRARGAASPSTELEEAISAAYLRLGDTRQSADAASNAIAQAPQTTAPYRLLASAKLIENNPEEAAIALSEGILATSDRDLSTKLATLYRDGLDERGCALVRGPRGVGINPRCEVVQRHACAAAARLAPVYVGIGRQDLASQLQAQVSREFGCR